MVYFLNFVTYPLKTVTIVAITFFVTQYPLILTSLEVLLVLETPSIEKQLSESIHRELERCFTFTMILYLVFCHHRDNN